MRPLLILLLASPLFAKPNVKTERIARIGGPNGVDLVSELDENGYTLKLGKKKIYGWGDPTGGGPAFHYKIAGPRDSFLGVLDVYHGDGCPSMNVVVSVLSENEYTVTEPFGNCNSPSRIREQNGSLEIDYEPREVIPLSEARTWVFRDRELRERH